MSAGPARARGMGDGASHDAAAGSRERVGRQRPSEISPSTTASTAAPTAVKAAKHISTAAPICMPP